MSRDDDRPDVEPFIALVEKAARVLRADMIQSAHRRGFTELVPAHNAVFATLPPQGARAVDMAARADITRQSMGEAIRDLARLGIVEMAPDPDDGRAKIVRFTDHGRTVARDGYVHLVDVEDRLREEFGAADLAAARRVLSGIRDLLT